MPVDPLAKRIPVSMAVLTVSDSRSAETDRSGDLLATLIQEDGHILTDRALVRDEIPAIQQKLNAWIDSGKIQAIILTGGTGLTGRDRTPEAVQSLFDREMTGFGEIFRYISWRKIHSSAIQSRAVAGVARGVYLFAVPGSPGACRDAWEGILREQFDSRFRPCNLVDMLPRLKEQ